MHLFNDLAKVRIVNFLQVAGFTGVVLNFKVEGQRIFPKWKCSSTGALKRWNFWFFGFPRASRASFSEVSRRAKQLIVNSGAKHSSPSLGSEGPKGQKSRFQHFMWPWDFRLKIKEHLYNDLAKVRIINFLQVAGFTGVVLNFKVEGQRIFQKWKCSSTGAPKRWNFWFFRLS